jgi:hypothetical protein
MVMAISRTGIVTRTLRKKNESMMLSEKGFPARMGGEPGLSSDHSAKDRYCVRCLSSTLFSYPRIFGETMFLDT